MAAFPSWVGGHGPVRDFDKEAPVIVRMKIRIGGTRDGLEWPKIGGTIDVPDHEAAGLIGNGYAVPADSDDPAPVAPDTDGDLEPEPEAEWAVDGLEETSDAADTAEDSDPDPVADSDDPAPVAPRPRARRNQNR